MKACASAALAGALSVIPAVATSIVVNGSFETGDLTGWTQSSSDQWFVADDLPIAGSFSAMDGCAGTECVDAGNPSAVAALSQNLPTTPGEQYTLTFLENNGGSPEDLIVLWAGNVVLDLCPGSTGCPNIVGDQFTLTGLVATSNSTELTFLGQDNPGYIRLDNVDVEDAGPAAPEPSTFFLGALGAAAMGRMRRRPA